MANFCTNCGTKLEKNDNYCINCGTKIEKDSYCINCGTKLGKDDKFCINCGTKIDKSNIKLHRHQMKSKFIRVEKEKEKKKLKTIDELFESEEIKSEIRKNKIDRINVISIKDRLKNDLSNNMSEEEIKDSIKINLKKVGEELRKAKIAKEKEMRREKINVNKKSSGGYCGLNCRHCYEEFLDDDGAIVGDFTGTGFVEYYCNLGHSIVRGRFCEDYE